MKSEALRVEIIEPHGFCSGVKGAIEKARSALSSGGTVWCLHELVHNETVVGELRERGMRFVESLEDVPEGETVLFSAHGVPPSARTQAAARGLNVIDATCSFVARAHRQVREFAVRGVPVAVVGDAGHVEVVGLVGEYTDIKGLNDIKDLKVINDAADVAILPFPSDGPVGVVCQTTLSSGLVHGVLSALRARYPRLVETPTAETCNATRDRQTAVRAFVQAGCPATTGVLVIGSANSANTARLVEIAAGAGARAMRVGGVEDLAGIDLSGIDRLGLTAGASTPEAVVVAVAATLDAKSVVR